MLEEHARLGALNDSVVVCARYRHDTHAAVAVNHAGGDDRSLPCHQPGNRSHGAYRARIRQRDRGALVGIGQQLVVAGACHHAFVFFVENPKGHRVSVLDDGHHEPALAVLPFHVHRESEIDSSRIESMRLAVLGDHRVYHGWESLGREHYRPSNQMGKRKLQLTRLELLVEGLPHIP